MKRQPKCVPALARLAELKLEARLYTGLLAPPQQQQVGSGGGGGGGSGAEASSSEAAEIHALMQMHGVAAAQMGSHAEARVRT